MIERVKNMNIKSKEELDDTLFRESKLSFATKEEVLDWPYKSKLKVSADNLIGKKLFEGDCEVGFVSEVFYEKHRGRKVLKLSTEKGKYSLTNCSFEFYNPLYEENQIVNLHPSRKGKKFWSLGYILNESDYKSLYYKTDDYRGGYEKTLNENLGTTGIKAPIQSKKIKDKISKTIEEKYGVNWFLERGCHYSAVTMTMQEKFGVDNLFNSSEWQIENSRNLSIGVSDAEISFVKYVNDLVCEKHPKLSKYSEYYGSLKDRDGVYDYKEKKLYSPDFINRKLKFFIEFNGDYWHCNPKMFDEDYYNSHKKMTAKQIWDKDLNRNKRVEILTKCKGLVVWESDWNKNKKETKEIIKKFLNEKR